jgi:competence ComEA-like helix-hairpin-helix protein
MQGDPQSRFDRNYVVLFVVTIASLAGVVFLLRREAPRPVVIRQPAPRAAVREAKPTLPKPTAPKPTVVVNNLISATTAAPSPETVPVPVKINLNTATLAELEALPRIGPVLAQRILDYRTEKGRFSSVRELVEVRGIGETIFSELEPLVSIE